MLPTCVTTSIGRPIVQAAIDELWPTWQGFSRAPGCHQASTKCAAPPWRALALSGARLARPARRPHPVPQWLRPGAPAAPARAAPPSRPTRSSLPEPSGQLPVRIAPKNIGRRSGESHKIEEQINNTHNNNNKQVALSQPLSIYYQLWHDNYDIGVVVLPCWFATLSRLS